MINHDNFSIQNKCKTSLQNSKVMLFFKDVNRFIRCKKTIVERMAFILRIIKLEQIRYLSPNARRLVRSLNFNGLRTVIPFSNFTRKRSRVRIPDSNDT